MKISRLLAAVLTAVYLGVPIAHAQDATSSEVDPGLVQTPDAATSDGPTDSASLPGKVIQATVTGYATGADGGAIGSMTASGVHTHWGTVAADWRVYPLGTKLQIEGFSNVIFIVEDTGSSVRGNIFDIWFPDLPTAVAFGTKSLKVTVLQQ